MGIYIPGEKFLNNPENTKRHLMNNTVIVETLREMLSDLCTGCGGCTDKCLDYQVLEYLLKEKGGTE